MGTLTAPPWGLPTDGLEDCGRLFEPVAGEREAQAPSTRTRRAGGAPPGSWPPIGGAHQRHMPRGPGPKTSAVLGGHKTRQVPHGRPQGHSPGAWHAPSCLPELAPRGATPRCPVCWARVLESREAGAGGRDGAAIGVKNAVLRRGRTHARCEPSEGGRAPIGPAAGAARVSEPKGGEMTRGGWASAHGLFPRSRQVAPGVRCALGDRDRGASARAREAGEVHRLAAVGVDAPPSRRGLFCPATESASRHQGRPQRRRAEGWPWRAADGGVAPWHRGGCQGCRGRATVSASW